MHPNRNRTLPCILLQYILVDRVDEVRIRIDTRTDKGSVWELRFTMCSGTENRIGECANLEFNKRKVAEFIE